MGFCNKIFGTFAIIKSSTISDSTVSASELSLLQKWNWGGYIKSIFCIEMVWFMSHCVKLVIEFPFLS